MHSRLRVRKNPMHSAADSSASNRCGTPKTVMPRAMSYNGLATAPCSRPSIPPATAAVASPSAAAIQYPQRTLHPSARPCTSTHTADSDSPMAAAVIHSSAPARLAATRAQRRSESANASSPPSSTISAGQSTAPRRPQVPAPA